MDGRGEGAGRVPAGSHPVLFQGGSRLSVRRSQRRHGRGWSNLVDLEARLIRIRDLRSSPDFEPLAASFKRIRNILDQQKFTGVNATAIDEKLLQDGPERDLYDEYRRIAASRLKSVVSQLRPKVDLFFDKC